MRRGLVVEEDVGERGDIFRELPAGPARGLSAAKGYPLS
jgi:hypothetical protein